MLTIALIAQKGGTGKTTIARCLAVGFERHGKAAAIIDLDPQASATLWAKRRKDDHPEVIPTVLPLLADTLEAARASVQVAILDTPPKNADAAIAAARAADLIIIPCRPQIDDIETLPATRQVLDVTGTTPVFVLLNGVPANASRIEEAARTISGHPTAAFPVCPHSFGHRAAFGDSSVLGQTPQEFDPRGRAAEEIENVYKYVCEIVKNFRSEKDGNTKTQHSSRRIAAKSAAAR